MRDVDKDAIDIFVRITGSLKDTLLWRRQNASISTVAINIAASPPNNRKVKKIIESEKFRMYFDLGKVILIRGAIKMVKANKRANFHERVPCFRR